MALIKSFEEILSWKKARILNKIIYQESNLSEFQTDFALKNQMRKSAISIMSNIAEGFERNNKKEFKYFLNVAKGSAGELRSQLYIANDLGYLQLEKFNLCIELVAEISRLISGFMDSLDEAIQQKFNQPIKSSQQNNKLKD